MYCFLDTHTLTWRLQQQSRIYIQHIPQFYLHLDAHRNYLLFFFVLICFFFFLIPSFSPCIWFLLLIMYSQPVQIPVLKQGVWEKGNWSTRVLTIDVATGTLTISRRNHPNNVLYHALQVTQVQLWPRFGQARTESPINSLDAKMSLRVVGEIVAVPHFSVGGATVTDDTAVASLTNMYAVTQSATAAANVEAGSAAVPVEVAAPSHTPETKQTMQSHFAFTASASSKKSRSLTAGSHGKSNAWMLRFTTFKSYELAVVLMQAMCSTEAEREQLFGPHLHADFVAVKKAWSRHKGIEGLAIEEASLM